MYNSVLYKEFTQALFQWRKNLPFPELILVSGTELVYCIVWNSLCMPAIC